MTDDVFMQEILAHPDDDTHRLVYADWLDDHGDDAGQARAALIRAQCQAERLPPGKQRSALEKQARKLIKDHPAWTQPIVKDCKAKHLVFRRGFLHQITLPAFRFVKVAEQLFRHAPTVRSVIFPEPLHEIEDLLACPYLERLSEADLSQMCECGWCVINEQIPTVFNSPLVRNLTRLRTAGNRLDAEGARVLAGSTMLPKLRELDLSQNELGNAGARVLQECAWMGQLTRLVLTDNGIGPRVTTSLRKRFGDALVI